MNVALELQPCCGNRAGIGNYTYELARRMVSDAEIVYQGNVFNILGRRKKEELTGIDMAVEENRFMSYGVYRRIWNVVPIRYSWMFPPADVTHFFNYIVPPRITGTVITTIHDMTYQRYPETVSATNLRRIRNGIMYSVERSQLIVTSSQFSKREIEELLDVPPERIIVVPAAASGVQATTAAVENRICDPYILYLGAIEPRKNIVRLLRAFELLKRETNIPHKLVLAGGRGWNCENIYKTAESICCRQDIVFRGYVSNAEKRALYVNATAFVFPSLYEGFGIPPLEAMSFGTPVVCSRAASLPEVAGDAACYVDPTSVESIAEGLWRVISKPDYAAELCNHGLERAKLFSWDRSAEILKGVYYSLLN